MFNPVYANRFSIHIDFLRYLVFGLSTVSLSLSHWYPGSCVVLDCIDS